MSVATRETLSEYYCEEIDGVLYPYAEVEPVVQGNWHFTTVKDAFDMVKALFVDRTDVGVYSDLFVYWERGNPRKKVGPDLIVLLDVAEPERMRRSMRLFEERSRPVLVLEALSDEPHVEDVADKAPIYRDELAIPELFVCDPWVSPNRIWAHRLVDGEYLPIEPDAAGRFWSEQLQAWFGPDDHGLLRVWDASGRPMPKYSEAKRLRDEALQRAEAEALRAQEESRLREAAEVRVRELEEELRRRPQQ